MHTLIRWFAARPANVRGLIWCLLAAITFMSMVMIVRRLSTEFNAGELAFWRALFGLLLLAPVLMRTGAKIFRTKKIRLHVLRNLMHFVAIAAWYYAISGINLSVGMSLQFSVPIITIILAIVFLGERVSAARWAATAAGFAGVLIILRPGIEPVTIFAIAAMVAAVGYAGANIATKMLSPDSNSDTIVFYMNAIHLPLALATAMLMGGFSIPSLGQLPWLVGVAASATLAHWLLAQALAQGDASVVIIGEFSKLPLVTIGAFLFFGGAPVVWAWLGGAIVFATTLYIVRLETRAAKTTVMTPD